MVNKVEVLGRLGVNPEVKVLENGTKLVRISVGTNEIWKDKSGNRQEETSWHNITMFGKVAENAEKILQKGSLVFVEGKLKYRTVEDESGKKTRYTDINARDFRIIADGIKSTTKQETSAETPTETSEETLVASTAAPSPQPVAQTSAVSNSEDDLPF